MFLNSWLFARRAWFGAILATGIWIGFLGLSLGLSFVGNDNHIFESVLIYSGLFIGAVVAGLKSGSRVLLPLVLIGISLVWLYFKMVLYIDLFNSGIAPAVLISGIISATKEGLVVVLAGVVIGNNIMIQKRRIRDGET